MSLWFFEQRDPRGVYNLPKHEEHFAHVRGIVTSLARETSQNSGDASDSSTGKPVRMRFRFGKVDLVRFKHYLVGLEPHLACFSNLAGLLLEGKVSYLAIEDFETHGLRGSYDPMSGGTESGYTAFWHRYGESGKSKEHGGRHGLGKSTVACASRLRMFFGATVPSDARPPRLLLQGQICLGPHMLDDDAGKRVLFDAYGLWYDKNDAGETIPFIDKAAAAFTHDFKLDRGRSSGLSLVIPYPAEELTPDALVRAIIENCFHQILSKHLVVEVENVVISASTIKELAVRHDLSSLGAAIDLSEEVAKGKLSYATPKLEAVKLCLKADHFEPAALKDIQKRWTDGKTVAVKLPISIKEKGKAAATGEVHLFIRRQQDEQLARETYVRGRVSVPMRGIIERSNCVGLLVADVGDASTFLGDSEPPAHDRWLVGRLKDKYIKPEDALKRIKYALRDLLSIVDAGDDERAIKDAFAEYLWSPRIQDEEEEDRPVKTKQPKSADDVPAPRPHPHVLQKVDGGFAYSYRAADEHDGTVAARILVSYRRRAAPKKSLKKTKFSDFDEEMPMEEVGSASVTQDVEARRIVFTLENVSPGYELRVTGFDANRDIELQLEAESA